jgi:hypothetical protein
MQRTRYLSTCNITSQSHAVNNECTVFVEMNIPHRVRDQDYTDMTIIRGPCVLEMSFAKLHDASLQPVLESVVGHQI